MDELLERAAEAIKGSEVLIISAGAGMGVDSGLPDFRGDQGFWKAYPAFEGLGISFHDIANPQRFREDPELAWGFYGHRLHLYRTTLPHPGYMALRKFTETRPHMIFTSNVDGAFQRAGFAEDGILEFHGSIHWAQCMENCGEPLFLVRHSPNVDPATMREDGQLPACKGCGGLARPNIFMFMDLEFDPERLNKQEEKCRQFLLEHIRKKVVIVECGAGTTIPSVRQFSERMLQIHGSTLIRINTSEPEVPVGQIGIPLGALEALRKIAKLIAE